MNNKQDRVEEAAQKGKAIAANGLAKADSLLTKTAALRHQISQLKEELAEDIANQEQKK